MTEPDPLTIGVLIPFFQREAAPLRRCLESVVTQILAPAQRLLLVVVDDESPLSLEEALDGVEIPAPHELVQLTRRNGGPGAARNTGLDYLSDLPVEFVAFIDSDDVWRPGHVSRALMALGDDADFFFCDHDRWNYPSSNFEGSETFREWIESSDAPFAACLNLGFGSQRIYQFRPDRAVSCFVQDYLSQTSTVVYRRGACETLRFDETLRYAGEDYLFWLQLAELARAVRFTTAKDVETGRGVNMYAASLGWSHPEAARRQAADIRFLLTIPRSVSLNHDARTALADRLVGSEAEFAQILLRKFARAPVAAADVLLPLLRLKPSLPLSLIYSLLTGRGRARPLRGPGD